MLGSGLLFVVVVVELEWFIMLLVFSVVMDVVVEEGFGLGVMASERKLFNKAISCGFLELGVDSWLQPRSWYRRLWCT